MLRGEQCRLVAAHGRLRRERVHRLRAGDARDRLHRERDDAAAAELLDSAWIGERLEEADQQLPLVQALDLLLVRLADLREDVRSPHVTDGRPGLRVCRIGERRLGARSRLDDDLEARGGELYRGFGHKGDPALPGRRLTRYSDPHRLELYSGRRAGGCGTSPIRAP